MIRVLLILMFSIACISTFGQEICDNEKDDDADGLIDLFDPDCDCIDNAYQAGCEIICDYVPENQFSIRRKWVSDKVTNEYLFFAPPVVGDLDGDGIPEIISLKEKRLTPSSISYKIYVVVFDSRTGDEITRWFHNNQVDYSGIGGVCLADANRDGTPEIFVISRDSDFVCYSPNGDVIWRTPFPGNQYLMPNIADFNCDGIPEIYVGNTILNAQTGDILIRDIDELSSCNFKCHNSHSIAADLRPSPGLELAAGNITYEVQINNTTGEVGNSLIPFTMPNIGGGLTSIGDIDGDGLLDVVVNHGAHSGNGGLWVYDPRTLQLIASASAGTAGSIPFIGDVDGDCQVDIGVGYTKSIKLYTYDGSNALSLMWQKTTSDQSGYTSISMFDFDQDGKNELVYRDESSLRVFNGENGDVRATQPVNSTTWHEYPVIADVDGDNEAEIIVTGNVSNGLDQQLLLYESKDLPWAPARAVWNQIGYHVTNVNDDLTIPKVPQNQAVFLDTDDCFLTTCPQPYNSFLTQATYRNQNGCVQFPVIDLKPNITSLNCSSEGIEVCITLENISPNSDFEGLLNISFYNGDPTILGSELYETDTLISIFSEMASDEICYIIPFVLEVEELFVVLNANSPVITPLSFPANGNVECDYFNNIDSQMNIDITQNLNLGPDQVLCGLEDIILDAGPLFNSYLWNTGETTQTISVNESGIYIVEATDFCNITYSDTIEIIKDDPDLINSETLSICNLSSTSISIDPEWNATNILWSPAEILNCTDCETVIIQPIEPTFVYLSAEINGCEFLDSIFIDLIGEITDTISLISCVGDSIQVDNTWYFISDTFSVIYTSITGCDSIIEFELDFSDPYSTIEYIEFCDGDSVFIDGNWFDESESYLGAYTTIDGCDSIINYIIEEIPSEFSVDTLICGNDSIMIFGNYVSIAGLYLDTLIVSDCSTVSIVNLDVQPIEMVNIFSTVCPGDTIYLDGDAILESGIHELLKINENGCDTIHIYEIVILDNTSPPTIDINCEEENNIVSILIPPGWDVLWDNGSTEPSTIYEDSDIVSVVLNYNTLCQTEYLLELPTIPETEFLPTLDDLFVLEGEEVEIDVALPIGWNILWESEASIDCNECVSVKILANTTTEVTATYIHSSGCTYEDSFLITVEPLSEIYIPNTFSPNGDHQNDLWTIDFGDIIASDIKVYDRWGNLIFFDLNKNIIAWDGLSNGSRTAQGVYVYILNYTDISGEHKTKIGDITIIY